MKTLRPVTLSIVLAAGLAAEIIDRIAVVVGGTVITASEIDRQIRLTAFLNGEKPDFSEDARRQAADRLVEQMLIRREMKVAGYAAAEASATNPIVERLRTARYKTETDYKKALAEYGLTDTEVREQLVWQTTLIRFVDVRFRPGIQIPAADIKDYYDRNIGSKPGSPTLEQSREQIEDILASERADNALDRWLGAVRTQTRIRFNNEVLSGTGREGVRARGANGAASKP